MPQTLIGTQHDALVTTAARLKTPVDILKDVFAGLSQSGVPDALQVVIRLSANDVIRACTTQFGFVGGALLDFVLGGRWQDATGLSDTQASALALTDAQRVLLFHAVIDECAVIVSTEAARLMALAATPPTVPEPTPQPQQDATAA